MASETESRVAVAAAKHLLQTFKPFLDSHYYTNRGDEPNGEKIFSISRLETVLAQRAQNELYLVEALEMLANCKNEKAVSQLMKNESFIRILREAPLELELISAALQASEVLNKKSSRLEEYVDNWHKVDAIRNAVNTINQQLAIEPIKTQDELQKSLAGHRGQQRIRATRPNEWGVS